MRAALLLVIACSACSSKDPPEPTIETPGTPNPNDVFTGEITVGADKPALIACKPGKTARVFVEVVTSKGKLRFEDMALYWNASADSPMRGDRLECAKLDRSWGGGNRMDGTSYWRGTLAFACMHGEVSISGNLDLDCGMITAEERVQLDKNRTEMKAQQAPGSGSAQ
jgi:hypothetical protein